MVFFKEIVPPSIMGLMTIDPFVFSFSQLARGRREKASVDKRILVVFFICHLLVFYFIANVYQKEEMNWILL